MVLQNKLWGCYWTNFYDQAKNIAKASLSSLINLRQSKWNTPTEPKRNVAGHFPAEIGSLDQFFY